MPSQQAPSNPFGLRQLTSLQRGALLLVGCTATVSLLSVAIVADDSLFPLVLTLAGIAFLLSWPFFVAIFRGTLDILEPIFIVCATYALYFVLAPLADTLSQNNTYFGVDIAPHLVSGLR